MLTGSFVDPDPTEMLGHRSGFLQCTLGIEARFAAGNFLF